jgi:hypothetical protein
MSRHQYGYLHVVATQKPKTGTTPRRQHGPTYLVFQPATGEQAVRKTGTYLSGLDEYGAEGWVTAGPLAPRSRFAAVAPRPAGRAERRGWIPGRHLLHASRSALTPLPCDHPACPPTPPDGDPLAPKHYDMRLRHKQQDVRRLDVFSRVIDFDDEAQVSTVDGLLVRLLAGAVKRSGGDVKDLDEYDLQLYVHGKGAVELTFAAAPSEVLDEER